MIGALHAWRLAVGGLLIVAGMRLERVAVRALRRIRARCRLSWWYIACVHLRPVEGAPPAHVRFPGATHEVMCLSLNPDPKDGRPRVPDVEKVEAGDVLGGLPGFLEPADWVVQVILPSDEKAAELVELVIDHIVAGRSCDSDYRSWWETSIQQTAEHLRLGGHPDEAT